jgi:sterol desaturase/sphingolipid hydroxylase (fatty acid hydroxylase superfamily)
MDSWIYLLQEANSAGYSDRTVFVLIVWLAIFVAFYLQGWFYILADWYGFLEKYAIRSGNQRLPPMEKQWDAIKEATIDCFLLKPVIAYAVYGFAEDSFIKIHSPMPSLGMGFLNWLTMKIIFSTSLYFFHRGMHHRYVYQYVHKKHHTHNYSVGFTSQYAHFIENIVSSLHVIFGILLVRPHFVVLVAFMFTTMWEIVDAHCGYDVPWAWLYPWSDRYPWGSGARVHDYHHSHNLGIYGGGLLGVWDKILGTDVDFHKFEAKRLASFKDDSKTN